jgi:transcriptional regulator with XRE-family HTH domain
MPNTVDPRPGERLCQIREHRETSQGRLARAIGVTVGTVQNYEHGRTHITAERLEQLAGALQCEATDLLQPPGSPPPRYRRPRYRPFQERASSRWYALNKVVKQVESVWGPWEQWVNTGDDD